MVMKSHETFRPPHRSSSDDTRRWGRCRHDQSVEPRIKKEEEKEAGRQKTLIRILRTFQCGSPFAKGARPPAFHHGSCQRDVGPQGSAPGQASWDVVSTGVIRCLLSQSGGCTPRTGHSTGEHDARSRPGVAVTSRHARAPHPVPISQGHRLTSFTANGIDCPLFKSPRQCQRESFLLRDCSNKSGCCAERVFCSTSAE
jgi:hypothetical protein